LVAQDAPKKGNLFSAEQEGWQDSMPDSADLDIADEYFETGPSNELEPEQNLMLAVLQDAVMRFQKYLFAKTDEANLAFREAEDWILDDDEKWLFSYRNVCETLDIDFQRLRQVLMQWKRRQLEEHSKRSRAQFN
jgi:hypothetical protein